MNNITGYLTTSLLISLIFFLSCAVKIHKEIPKKKDPPIETAEPEPEEEEELSEDLDELVIKPKVKKVTRKKPRKRPKTPVFPEVHISSYLSDRDRDHEDPEGIVGLERKKTSSIIRLARKFLGKKHRRFRHKNKSYNGDCSGFMMFLFATHRVGLLERHIKLRRKNMVAHIYYSMKYNGATHRKKYPKPGDLVFFHDTFDFNRDKKTNDPLTHIGLVEKVTKSGTIYFIHYLNPYYGVVRDRLNLRRPNDPNKNSYIRSARRFPHPKKKYLTGQLFAGFARVRM
ncbi:MAG: NlpC/P60 family protein [Spirochaetota bacterium]|nr:NlpC/P60 family protein [Spirochaetota bacterium]